MQHSRRSKPALERLVRTKPYSVCVFAAPASTPPNLRRDAVFTPPLIGVFTPLGYSLGVFTPLGYSLGVFTPLGYSLGGNVALHAAALDARVSAVAAFAAFTPMRTDLVGLVLFFSFPSASFVSPFSLGAPTLSAARAAGCAASSRRTRCCRGSASLSASRIACLEAEYVFMYPN